VCYEQRTYVADPERHAAPHGGMGYRLEGSEHEDETYFGMIYTLDTGYADKRPDDDWAIQRLDQGQPDAGPSQRQAYADGMLADLHQGEGLTMASQASSAPSAATSGSPPTRLDGHGALEPLRGSGLREEEFADEECCVGLDAAFKTDIFAKVKVFAARRRVLRVRQVLGAAAPGGDEGQRAPEGLGGEGLIEVSRRRVVDVEAVKTSCGPTTALHACARCRTTRRS
jgi:hypothetical protein